MGISSNVLMQMLRPSVFGKSEKIVKHAGEEAKEQKAIGEQCVRVGGGFPFTKAQSLRESSL